MRKISKTLALMSLLAPLGANALGIGDIRLHSALNQSLNAEIPLVTSGGDEISDIRVTLASPEAFARAGIERHYLLSKLRFSPRQKEDGSYVIEVSSQESISEPFLNFLIEVYWPQGRLQREFTVLLDPPASFQEADESAESDLPETAVYQRPYDRPVRRQQPAYIEPAPVKPRSRPIIKEARVSEPPQAPAEETPITGTQYGPINRNETLWSIASQHNQDASISQEKMLRAIYKANPQAFYKNSINALKAGETITIPDRETIVRLTGAPLAPPTLRSPARPAVRAERVAKEAPATGDMVSQGQLKLLAPTPSKSKDEVASSGGNKGKGGKSREDIALEVADSFKQENEEIRKRLADFEQQLTGMQRLLSLKNEEIAALQAQKQAAKQSQQTPPAPTNIQPPAPTVPSAETAKTPSIVAEPPKESLPAPAPGLEAQKTPSTSEQKPPDAAVSVPPQPATPIVPPAQTAKPVRPVTPAKQPAPATNKVEKEEGVVAELLEHPSYYLVGGIIGLLGITLWLIKRRRAAMIDDTESILTLSDREKIVQSKRPPIQLDQPSGMSEQSATTARSSFLSEFTPSDFDALGGEMEEVDPISEADVYLAYGRYKQAEELIRSAIAQNPERDECKLKLLEIHYATENAEAFENFAEELSSTHKDTKPEFWEKVAEMGQELCPESPLFGAHSRVSSPNSTARTTSTPIESKPEVDTEENYFFQNEGEETYGYPISPVAEQQRFDADEESQATTIAYDFFSPDLTEPELREDVEEKPSFLQADNIIAFEKPHSSPAGGAMDIQDKTLDDILAELGVLSESTSLKKSTPEEIDDDAGIPFDLGIDQILEVEEEAPHYEDDSSDYMALTEMDEHETKLDLAKAYFDMGDDESARVILENVAQDGNDAQKEEAWSLLGKLTKKEVNRR